MRARVRVALAGLATIAGCASPPAPAGLHSDGRYAMGTVLEVSLIPPRHFSAKDLRNTFEALFNEASRLDALMTSFEPDSDVSRLNRSAGRGPLRVDGAVGALLSQSIVYARLTQGSFDVTVGPLVDLWIEAAERGEPPSKESLASARERVGIELLAVHGDGRAELLREGAAIDLGGIAKGFALDRMVPLIRNQGVSDAMLSFGQSSIWALGAPEGAPGWRLRVRGAGESYLGDVTLRDQALSVSDSLGRVTRIGGVEYGHILDPRTGTPLTRRRQALVVAPNAALAEALSKALLVDGENEGIAIVEAQRGCEGLLADEEGRTWMTSGWQEAVFFRPAQSPRMHRQLDDSAQVAD